MMNEHTAITYMPVKLDANTWEISVETENGIEGFIGENPEEILKLIESHNMPKRAALQ
jgi:hypothetical protein